MAVQSRRASRNMGSAKKGEGKETEKRKQVDDDNGHQSKRTKCPGVRLVGSRIYDSENGKTCHQCRQKTRDFVASCKNQNVDKLCPINFCHKCLLNRYGEKAEEVSLLEDWTCPRCRGICNCSFCMKKRGQKPTGILVHAAKATGFNSVSEMLHVKGPGNLGHDKIVENIGVSPKKKDVYKEPAVISPRKRGKENSFVGTIAASSNSNSSSGRNKSKKQKLDRPDGTKEISNGIKDDVAFSKQTSSRKPKVSEKISNKEVETNGKNGCVLLAKKDKKKRVLNDVSNAEISNIVKAGNAKASAKAIKKCIMNLEDIKVEADLPLPMGTIMKTIVGIELPPEDVLDVTKGQPESVLRELIRGRIARGCGGQYSTIVRIHAQLLSLIQEDMGEKSVSLSDKNSWFQALEKHISESKCASKELSSVCFGRDGRGYDVLDFSKKLRLLNFLCDEALCTTKLRSWIDEQNSKFYEREKESKEKVAAAKNKQKLLKQKLQDKIAKAIVANDGPLSIPEHEALVSKIKTDSAQAQAEILEAMGAVLKRRQISDAVRTEPNLLDAEGRVFWKLRSYSNEQDFLLQDMGTWDGDAQVDKWFVFDSEQKEEIEMYISSPR
ncbi:hypothetical protein FNV43_RR13598 [Rhamnella rubrinervis]|uniref:Zinc-finger domain-containing protein n=1 Tax=Rhamnella rubrinervis TaxID=2594499 RepID=A0A8K0H1M5_9ROSA|nr:hypothetical protein FNV43_RR13598 [Rhamnella rubrinervis]